MGWKGESRRHSLSRKGIKTAQAKGCSRSKKASGMEFTEIVELNIDRNNLEKSEKEIENKYEEYKNGERERYRTDVFTYYPLKIMEINGVRYRYYMTLEGKMDKASLRKNNDEWNRLEIDGKIILEKRFKESKPVSHIYIREIDYNKRG